MSEVSLEGRTAIVTGAGGGLGRAEALALAAAGARVVVNDLTDSADAVVAEIKEAGGQAVAVQGSVADWSIGERLVGAAVDTFGKLDIVLNNAGNTRDMMVFNLTEDAWDSVLSIHLKGHAAICRAATAYWRDAAKAGDGQVFGRVINTASEAFLFGAAGQPNYSAAKAGIVALTLSVSSGMRRYGVTANAICPRARTEMTASVFSDETTVGGLDIMAPERVASFTTYLASEQSQEITGQVFVVYGDFVALMAAPKVEHVFRAADGVFSPAELDDQMSPYFVGRTPAQTYAAYSVNDLNTTGITNVAKKG